MLSNNFSIGMILSILYLEIKIFYLHIITDTVAPIPGLIVIRTGGGDEVITLARIELKRIGHGREGTEPDGEHSEK